MNEDRLDWVQGNTLDLLIPMQLVSFEDGGRTSEDYTPSEEAQFVVKLDSKVRTYTFTPTVEENVAHIHDDGTIACGIYSVILLITEQDGTRYRSKMKDVVWIHDSNDEVLDDTSTIPEWASGGLIDASVSFLVTP